MLILWLVCVVLCLSVSCIELMGAVKGCRVPDWLRIREYPSEAHLAQFKPTFAGARYLYNMFVIVRWCCCNSSSGSTIVCCCCLLSLLYWFLILFLLVLFMFFFFVSCFYFHIHMWFITKHMGTFVVNMLALEDWIAVTEGTFEFL